MQKHIIKNLLKMFRRSIICILCKIEKFGKLKVRDNSKDICFSCIFQQKKLKDTKNKGSLCSIEGKKYEMKIYDVIKSISNKNLGGCSSEHDIICNINNLEIPIEIKKFNTPDWMQCSIKFLDNQWTTTKNNSKIPDNCKMIFENIIKDKKLFNGEVPPFFYKKLTHQEWIEIKKNTDVWNDIYFQIQNTTIRDLYASKGCKYIQISQYGLYHLGNDIGNFGVPEFVIEQQLRIRIKIHSSKDAHGNCNLSVMMSCQPKNIKNLIKSPFTLDDPENLPEVLRSIINSVR